VHNAVGSSDRVLCFLSTVICLCSLMNLNRFVLVTDCIIVLLSARLSAIRRCVFDHMNSVLT